MPKLYIEEYTRSLAGKRVYIACREGILRDHFQDILADIKFLNRVGIRTTLFHNMSNRSANRKHFEALANRLSGSRIIRVPADLDFYDYILDYPDRTFKLIFLERKYLIDPQGRKINTLTTTGARDTLSTYGDLIANVNFKSVLERLCLRIEAGQYDRVHILPAGKYAIKHELFSIDGSGTLIANNFSETFKPISSEMEIRIVAAILALYRRQGFLKPRSRTYIEQHQHNFYITQIDGIIVGCIEKKEIDPQTVELGALAISTKFRSQHVGGYTVNAFMAEMIKQGYTRFISLTNNPKLARLYHTLGFAQQSPPAYRSRQEQSPGVKMFFKQIV